MTLTTIAERLAVELLVPVYDLGLSQLYKQFELYFTVHHFNFSKSILNAVFVKNPLNKFRLTNQYTISVDLVSGSVPG